MSFVFYDTETTGLSKPFDQIVRFAAVRTDADLIELERVELQSRLCPHVIPHPRAMRVNRIRIRQLTNPALPSHYSMVQSIHAKLRSWSPSIFVGYNSIRFDEEMLRQAFYQTLHPPYLTSLHNNGRADALTLALYACSKLANGIRVAMDAEGKRVFRLTEFARVNGIHHAVSHDALSDVLATVDICRMVRARSPDAWNAFARFSRKAPTLDFMSGEDGFLLTEFYANQAVHTPVVFVGADPRQGNLCYCLVLNGNTRHLLQASDEELTSALAERPSPIRRVRANAAPCVQALWDIDESDLDLSVDELEALAREAKSQPEQCRRLVELCHAGNTDFAVSLHPEERIYEKFAPPGDEMLLQRFHQVPWKERPSLIEQLQDDRLRALGLRLIHAEAPDALNPSQRAEVLSNLSWRAQGSDGFPLCAPAAVCAIDDLLEGVDAEEREILVEYRAHLRGLSF